MRGQGARLIIWFQTKTRQQSVCGFLSFEFYHRPGKRQDSRNSLFSQFSWSLNVFKPWSQRERICWLSQFSRQVQDSQCSPLASACEGKYRYCVAPCHCLTMSEALRKVSLQVQRKLFKTAGGSTFSQRVTMCHNMFEIASVGSGAPLSPLNRWLRHNLHCILRGAILGPNAEEIHVEETEKMNPRMTPCRIEVPVQFKWIVQVAICWSKVQQCNSSPSFSGLRL